MTVSNKYNNLISLLHTYDGVSAKGNANASSILQKIMFSFETIYNDTLSITMIKNGYKNVEFKVTHKNKNKFRTIIFVLEDIVNISAATMTAFDHICSEFSLCPIPYICGRDINITEKLDSPFPEIKDVIFKAPATIVFWSDGTKTVVRSQCGEKYDPEKGLAMAISKKALGNTREYYHKFLHWEKKYKKTQEYKNSRVEAEKVYREMQEVINRTESVTLMSDGHSVVQINKESED